MEGDTILDQADGVTDNEILIIDEMEGEGPVELGVRGDGARFALRLVQLECQP